MKILSKYTLISFSLIALIACNDDFLTETNKTPPVADTSIIVSPEEDTKNYLVYYYDAGDAKFSIVNAPEWLMLSSKTGQFNNGIAQINCKAKVWNAFSNYGIYHSSITLKIENKGEYIVPVSYSKIGNPIIETKSSLAFLFEAPWVTFHIRNKGEGILIWEVAECPEWIDISSGIQSVGGSSLNIIPQNGESYVYLNHKHGVSVQDKNPGRIVIRSNDKNNPEAVTEIVIVGNNIP